MAATPAYDAALAYEPPPVMAGRQPTGFEYCADAVPEQVWLQLRSWLATDTTIPWERAAEGRRVSE